MRYLLLVLPFVSLVACTPGPGADPSPYRMRGPADPFAQIEEGMSPVAVKKLLGEPDDVQERHITGKVFIPFYFGDDAWEETWCYKGRGRVVFSGGVFWSTAVYDVDRDSREPGICRR